MNSGETICIMIDIDFIVKSWPIIMTCIGTLIFQVRANAECAAALKRADERITAVEDAANAKIQAMKEAHDEHKLSVWQKLDSMQSMMTDILRGVAKLEGRLEHTDTK